MSDVTKIKLPDNSELNIKDYRIPGVDSTPTSGSNNVVTSGGIHTAIVDTELVVATALNDLNDRVSDLEDDGSGGSGGISEKTYAIPFGHIDSTSTSTEFTATVDNFPSTLSDGVCAYIYNGVVSSASGCTLNINNTGAKPIYGTMELETAVTTNFSVNYTMLFIYNSTRVSGGCWDMFYGYYTTTAYRMRFNNGTKTVTGATYRYRLLFTSADGTQWVPSNSSSSTNATASRTVSQTKIDPFGPIVYYANTTAISAGGSPGASYLNEQYVITLGYSFNRTGAALVLTTKTPVYIKCAPQTDGSAIIDADTPYVQSLPLTEDGEIYIYLGIASSATQVEVALYHPVYYYKNGAIRLWTNALSSDDYLPISGGEMDDAASITVSRRHGNGPSDTIVISGSNIDFTGYEETGMRLDCANSKLIISDTAPSIWTDTTERIEYSLSNIYKRVSSSAAYTYTFPNKTGTFAMTSDIPAAVTESTVSNWGFTKNTGTYSKPSGGIPATDLASAVQTSLGKADTALQSFTETDPTVPSWAKQSTKPTYTASEVGALPSTTVIPTKVSDLTNDSGFTSNTGTITGITMNGSSKGTSGVVNLGTVLTSHQDISGKADLSGAAFTGTVTGTSYGNASQFRNITISSSEPTASDGSNGDVWIVI